jgi:glucoamylase
VKLTRSLRDGRVFDMPPQTVQRYLRERRESALTMWCVNNKLRSMGIGKTLRVSTRSPALVHWSTDDWRSVHDTGSIESGLGIWYSDLSTSDLSDGATVRFTLFWIVSRQWEGTDFAVIVRASESGDARAVHSD